jgi:hypothetical protein
MYENNKNAMIKFKKYNFFKFDRLETLMIKIRNTIIESMLGYVND